ncbi:hypothetical protein J5X84_08865 [Streptosporangiaceae bacterium NEAU-GS5]|nr:hypothetical protein [Streptosporangiaceae bacterium NEAU-GS5]
MTQILLFIAAYMDYLWKDARFRITGSEVSTSFGNALLHVESENLRIRFVSDRGQLLLGFQPAGPAASKEWYSIDLVRRLFLHQREDSSVLDPSYARFLEENLAEVEARFTGERWPDTRADLKKLEAKRSKEMFG